MTKRSRPQVREPAPTSTIDHISRLPPEILTQIFTYCIPATNGLDKPKPLPSKNFDTADPPWIFVQINRKWRDVSLSAHMLWSTIAIRVDSFASDRTGRDAFYLKTVLNRSKGWPLSVRLDSKHLLLHRPRMQALVDILIPTSRRWSFLELNGPVDWWNSYINIEHEFSDLRELLVGPVGYDQYGPGITPKWPAAFALVNAPQMRRLTCREPGLTDCLRRDDIALPLARLSWCYIDHEYDVYHDFHRMLTISPNLEFFRLAGNASGFIIDPPTDPVHHSHLAEWHCIWRDQKDLDAFIELLNLLTLPALRVLTLWIDWDEILQDLLPHPPYWSYSSAFVSFVERSACSLRQLRLTSIPFDDEKLLQCLKTLPSLEALEIIAYPSKKYGLSILHNGVISDEFIARLNCEESDSIGEPILLPNLTRLLLEDFLLINDDAAFVDMVESRWTLPSESANCSRQKTARLSTVSLVLPGTMDSDALTRLNVMRDTGLDVQVYRRKRGSEPSKLKQLLPSNK